MAWVRNSYNKVRAILDLDGYRIPIHNATVTFELNGIPTAAVSLAVGRNTTTGAASPVHRAAAAAKMRDMVPAKIYVTIDGTTSDGTVRLLAPSGEFIFFDGYVSGMSPGFNGNAADVTLTLVHWLTLLDEGSAFSRSTHPASPADYSFGALMPTDGAGVESKGVSDLSQPTAFVTAETVGKDFWAKALLPWFKKMADRDGIAINERNFKPTTTSDRVKKALNRMSPKSPYSKPLSFRVVPDADLAATIAEDVADASNNAAFFGNQTFWNVLVGNFAPSYAFAVVPRVEDAMVVPYIAGYAGNKDKKDYLAVVRAGEYNSGRMHSAVRRTLRAVGILSGTTTRTNLDLVESGGRLGIGGFYDTGRDGLTLITNGPPWMSRLIMPTSAAAKAAGAAGEPKATAVDPRAAKSTKKPDAEAKRQDRVVKPLLDAYAKARFADEVFRGRQIPIAGAFRWDIAPGSLVAVEGTSELFLAADALDTTYYGIVARATHSISSEPPEAASGFHLISLRYADENADSKVALDSHPFYNDAFPGAPMRG